MVYWRSFRSAMGHTRESKTPAIIHHPSGSGKGLSLPAVPVLQKKPPPSTEAVEAPGASDRKTAFSVPVQKAGPAPVQRQISVAEIEGGEPFDQELDFVQSHWGFNEAEKKIYLKWLKDDQPRRYPTKKLLVSMVKQEAAAPAGGTGLTGTSIRDAFTEPMRAGVGKFTDQLLHPGAGKHKEEKALYAEGLKHATLAYDAILGTTQSTLSPGLALPPAGEITRENIQTIYEAIKADTGIKGEGEDMHLETDRSRDEGYSLTYQHNAREKIAGVWAEAARSVLRIRGLLHEVTTPNLQFEIRAAKAKAQGRDLKGRMAYHLMNFEPGTIAEGLIGNDPKEGPGKLKGMGQLSIDMADAFSNAACHNDARQFIDILSHRLFYKEERVITASNKEATKKDILGQLDACRGERKLLKLTNFSNHSVVYLVGDGKAAAYESIATPDSTTILYNELIQGAITETDAKPRITAGIDHIATTVDGSKLVWEVHETTNAEQLKQRVEGRLRRGATAMGIATTLAAREAKQTEEDGDLPDHGFDLELHKVISVPASMLNQEAGKESVMLFNYSDGAKQGAPTAQATYRLSVQDRWLKVIFNGVSSEENIPKWMRPCMLFEVVEVSGSYAGPQLRAPMAGETATTFMQFIMQVAKKHDQLRAPGSFEHRVIEGDGARFTVTADPFWPNGGFSRRILYTREDL
jgi:hypothetical protein